MNKAQEFMIGKMQISWLEISHLFASAEPSPFPALTQIEVYGIEVREEDEKNETNWKLVLEIRGHISSGTVAHGALAMATQGEMSMVSQKEVESVMDGINARVKR